MGEQRPSYVPLISEHDTWISIDPLVGCPASCVYCYLGPLGLRARKPQARVAADELAAKLGRYLRERSDGDIYGQLANTPICFGNYTDTFMLRSSVEYFMRYAKLHATLFGNHPLCVVTKARLQRADLEYFENLAQPLLIFMSQSFLRTSGLPAAERGPTCGPGDTVANVRLFAGLRQVMPIHFLRPVGRRSVSSLSDALVILDHMQGAGCLATVAVGLKVGAGIDLAEEEIERLVGMRAQGTTGEVLAEEVREWLVEAAGILDYPLYFHTSCAVALATERVEALGTWRDPIRCARCEPCVCPAKQRSRCDKAYSAGCGMPSAKELSVVSMRYGLPDMSLRWSPAESAVELDNPVSQYTFNRLVHALPYRLIGRRVQPEEAWLGDFARAHKSSLNWGSEEARDLLVPGLGNFGDKVIAAIERLRGITGFVTTLHKLDDLRPLAFARYYHVRRVAWVARWLLRDREVQDAKLSLDKVRQLAWGHDLNRWPFAHNSERDLFDQARDVARYFMESGIRAEFAAADCAAGEVAEPPSGNALLSDLSGVISKDPKRLSGEGRLVLLADMIAGFIEDPLLAITGLDLSPRLIPEPVRELLVLPCDEEWFVGKLLALNMVLYEKRDFKAYVRSFDALFRQQVREFVRKHSLRGRDPFAESWFWELRRVLKEEFLKQVLFPYNNEKIAHGTRLKEELIVPLLGVLGDHAVVTLTTIDEAGVIGLARSAGIIDAGSEHRYLPDLDYMAAREPQNSFRSTF